MRKLLIVLFCIVQAHAVTSDLGKIALSIVVPGEMEGLTESQLSKLDAKVSQIVTASGLAAGGYSTNFAIYPKFSIYDNSVVEGGMQNINVATVEVSFFIKQVDNNMLFSSTSLQVKGSGSSPEAAVTNAIAKIPVHDARLNKFIAEGKTRIIAYYESKCPEIIEQGKTLIKMKQYASAISRLLTIPEEVSGCYGQALSLCYSAYSAYSDQLCATRIEAAKAALAQENYDSALAILGDIDPSSSCHNDAQVLMNQGASKVDAEKKRDWNVAMKVYNDSVALERQRISAMEHVASEYYQSQPEKINYTEIIK